MQESLATFQTSQGARVQGALLRLSHHAAAFEVHGLDTVIRTSEVLEGFQVLLRGQPVYSGRAVAQAVVNTGSVQVCSVVLEDFCFDAAFFASLSQAGRLRERFDEFLRQWEKVCKVRPEFKVAIADIQTFLTDLRRWLEQIELGIRSSPKLDRAEQERAVAEELCPVVLPVIDALFERFETIAAELDAEATPVHRSYIQRHLHPIVLCAPFANRTYTKPLGYAGDYEMVNMMLRDPCEGYSLFAKVFNCWLLHQGSAAAHRNRIDFLKQRLIAETAAAARAGRKARILNLGCGPAREVQEFLAQSELSNHAQLTLLDFNEETLTHASQALRQQQQQHGRTTAITLAKKSVQQLLKEMSRASGAASAKPYDLIYCAGLFDYLSDHICKRLVTLFYQSVQPGGLVLVTNVAPFNPNRGSLELILDWHLVYRDAARMAELRPEGLPREAVCIQSDETGVNVFLEARRPNGP